MSAFTEKLTYLELKKAEIKAIDLRVAPRIAEIQKEFEEKVEALKSHYNDKVNEVKQELENESSKYRAELKAWCGITEGEQVDPIEVVKMVKKISEMQ